jgi:hypothetical protein
MDGCQQYKPRGCDNRTVTDVQQLVDDMAALMGAPCTLEDPDFRLIAFSHQGHVDSIDVVRQRSILERRSTPEVREWFRAHGISTALHPVRTPASDEWGVVSRVCVPARHNDRVHGYFWVLDPSEAVDERAWPEAMALAEVAGALLGVAERRQARRDGLYFELLELGSLSARQSASELADAAGIEVDAPVTCILIERPGLSEQLASRPTRTGVLWIREAIDMAAAVCSDTVLRGCTRVEDALDRLGLTRRIVSLDSDTTIGIGPTVQGLDQLAVTRLGAMVALRVARYTGPAELMPWSDLGPLTLLGLARDEDLSTSLLSGGVRRLLGEGSQELIKSALIYLEEAGSASRTAERLNVHRQTVYQRLSMVEKLTGCDFRSGKDRLQLHLALILAPFVYPPRQHTRPRLAPAGQHDSP